MTVGAINWEEEDSSNQGCTLYNYLVLVNLIANLMVNLVVDLQVKELEMPGKRRGAMHWEEEDSSVRARPPAAQVTHSGGQRPSEATSPKTSSGREHNFVSVRPQCKKFALLKNI